MIEIAAQVDLSHPADRVWRAMTDRELLARWFSRAEAVTGERGRLRLHTAEMPGFDTAVDAAVIDRRAPELITLRFLEPGRRTRLTCTLTATAAGCRLSVQEVVEDGGWSAEQRARREQSYQQALTGRLPAILDWLAFQQVDLRRGAGTVTAHLPVVEVADGPPRRRSRRPAVIAVLAVAVLGTWAAAWVVLSAEPERTVSPEPAPMPTAEATTGRPSRSAAPSARPTRSAVPTTVRPSPTATPTTARTSAPVAPPPTPVTARYETVSTRFFGYTGTVVVQNPGGSTANEWTVVVTLPRGSTVTDASGTQWRQDEQTVTFTGQPLPARQSRAFSFDVRDSDPLRKAPQDCRVGDEPCAGL